tara:strand:- start:1524 stop:2297 length:774 start_codon:yes stop_codon:yes gene_type:complete
MKVVILAGGFGSRLGDITENIPKPMVDIGGKPILWHLMNIFSSYGYNEFILALGYKSKVIKNYFLNFNFIDNDFEINLLNNNITNLSNNNSNWKISLIETGLNTMTGGRLKQVAKYLNNESFFLTYGDGLADVNLNSLFDFHKQHKKMVTITAVRPSARFGELDIRDNKVMSFEEKPQVSSSWINGGFMVIEPSFIKLIDNNATILEKEPLEKVCSLGEMMAYKHHGFWQCMDTKRDKDYLEQICNSGKYLWLKDGK